jgi:hypothetical protein
MKSSIPSHPFGTLWGGLTKYDKQYYQGKITLKQLTAKVQAYRNKVTKDAIRDEKRQTAKWNKMYGLSTKHARTGYPWILNKIMR